MNSLQKRMYCAARDGCPWTELGKIADELGRQDGGDYGIGFGVSVTGMAWSRTAATEVAKLFRLAWNADVRVPRYVVQRFIRYIGPRNQRSMIAGDDVEVFDGLPDAFTVYRGAGVANASGMAWSLDYEVAQKFAQFAGGHVYARRVTKPEVLLYTNARGLQEVVLRKCEAGGLEKSAVLERAA